MFAYPDSDTGFRIVYMAQFGQAHPRVFNYQNNYREIILGIKLYFALLLKKFRFDKYLERYFQVTYRNACIFT
jgi:hypothetical protein